MAVKNFISTASYTKSELETLLDNARTLRARPNQSLLTGKSAALLFYNPSLRTRSSFQIGLTQLGANSIVLDAQGTWPLEILDGAVMDADKEEHIKEAARVLSRYVDLICIRAFPKFQDWTREREDPLITAFAKYASVPIINMETIIHPCQELAMLMALQDAHGMDLTGKKFVLTWTYHPKPLNTAVANSALLAATKMGMDVTLLCPTEDYILDEKFMTPAGEFSQMNGQNLKISHNIEEAYTGADAIYAKSWGAIGCIGRPEAEAKLRAPYEHFIVNEEKMALTQDATFSHCLPMRRNVKATDGVADSPRSLIIEEAENRLHVQKSIIANLMGVSPK